MIPMFGGAIDPMRAALGDPDYLAKLQQQTKSDNPAEAADAKAVLARASFIVARKDEAAQAKALDAFSDALKTDPANETIVRYLARSHSDKLAAKASVERIEKILKEESKNKLARQALDGWAADARLASLINKPLTIKIPKVDGTAFSSDALKGKVIVVDFWATWCGPCIAEFPRVQKVYDKYHAQGLEIISISCDENADVIKTFLAKHPEITWTQLFDPKTPGWDAATQFGVRAIPALFVIDKKGICRTVEGREKMDDLIPKLLAE
jgi:thiol-disulfide isomerase/thioredoxin